METSVAVASTDLTLSFDDASGVAPSKRRGVGVGESAEETRDAAATVPPSAPAEPSSPPKTHGEVKENRWKLAFRQLMFMKQMNMQVNDRNKNEIELRQQNITPLSLICSVPFFNTFGASDIQRLVDACKRVPLRPGGTLHLPPTDVLADQQFFIVISGHLAFANGDTDNAQAIQLANLSPKFKLGIGDYFAIHRLSNARVIAMEPVEYLQISMKVIRDISDSVAASIESERTDMYLQLCGNYKLEIRQSVFVMKKLEAVAARNFVRSCAGYCVATYVLGIGDRHNDNIMLQRSGKLFHIDFGHFLGNFKTKLGFKRERAPFVFTPAMLHVMGGKTSKHYSEFKRLACEAFKVLRSHSNLLITLLVLALTCGTPELTCEDDIKWVHQTLMLGLSDDEALEQFQGLIEVALNTKTTQFNDAVHLLAH
ncbi:hypothetical protein P43SY_005656 [Pythium insidiosum]|uniref:PI3K/PI4K catalytic domain-containing protein n=1 Tax=Pythium insidiosum TaxID=114742 RepID=A0AAD5Q7J3_PYTIN|nr:hypothetical protein P43SY_005656 [Pythium insidiosum]